MNCQVPRRKLSVNHYKLNFRKNKSKINKILKILMLLNPRNLTASVELTETVTQEVFVSRLKVKMVDANAILVLYLLFV